MLHVIIASSWPEAFGLRSSDRADAKRLLAPSDYEKAAIVGAIGETLVATLPAST